MINVVENYSSALYEIYLESSKEIFFNDLKSLKLIFKNHVDLIKLLGSLMLSKSERNDVIDIIFLNKIEKMLVNFMHILIENNSFNVIKTIIDETLLKIDEEQAINFATVETPFELDNTQIEKIKGIISKRKGGRTYLEIIINKSLIGGIKISFGSEVIDGSIKYRMEQIKKNATNL